MFLEVGVITSEKVHPGANAKKAIFYSNLFEYRIFFE